MKKILIISGELSGDQHAAALVKKTTAVSPDVHFFGMGGKYMKAAGVDTIVNSEKLAVVGFFEVFTHFFSILKAFNQLKKALFEQKPDLVILVDYPGFNLRFAKIAKKASVKVLYYISPQLWAWHKSRIRLVKQYVDYMAVILPFEVDFYQKHGVKASFVGHPLIEKVKASMTELEAREYFNITLNKPIIGLLTGSRKKEVDYLLIPLLKTAERIKQHYPDAQFILPLASTVDKKSIQVQLSKYKQLNVHCIEDQLYNTLQLCDVVIAASGTVTLEIGLLSIPTILVYKLNPINYWLAKQLITLPYIGLCNIILNKAVMKECIQYDVTPKKLFFEVQKILDDPVYRNNIEKNLMQLKEALGNQHAENIEDVIIRLLD